MAAEENARRRLHRACIELALDQPNMAALHRQRRAAIDDPVEIMPAYCRKPRIKSVRHALGGKNRNGLRPHMRIQAVAQHIGPPILGKIRVRDLP